MKFFNQRTSLWVGALFVLGLTWVFASPIFSAPDEPAHFIKSVATVRGQIYAPEKDVYYEVYGKKIKLTEYQINSYWDDYAKSSGCFAFKSDQTADCQRFPKPLDKKVIGIPNSAGNTYPPLYYAIVGIPTLFSDGTITIYLSRIFSLFVCCMLIVIAYKLLGQHVENLRIGLLCSLTPMCVYLFSSINPNGFEIAAALYFISACIDFFDDKLESSIHPHFIISSCLLIQARPSSFLWWGFALILLVFKSGLRTILANIRTISLNLIIPIILFIYTVYVSFVKYKFELPGYGAGTFNARDSTFFELGKFRGFLEGILGYFGWLDTPPPAFAFIAFILLIGLVVSLILRNDNVKIILLSLCVLSGIIILPGFLEVIKSYDYGFPWQGRYLLPLFSIGVVYVFYRLDFKRFENSIYLAILALVMIMFISSYYWVLRRYMVGLNGDELFQGSKWFPPIKWYLLLVVNFVSVGILCFASFPFSKYKLQSTRL